MLVPERIYHIYNQANGRENLFREERNYEYFMEKYFRYTDSICETFCYCLMPNHFHAMIRLPSTDDLITNLQLAPDNCDLKTIRRSISKQFSNLFNAYAKAVNKTYNRRGSLFQRPFKYKEVEDEHYLTKLVVYIHHNPVKHGFTASSRAWPHSSIHQYLNSDLSGFSNPDRSGINREAVINWFGNIEQLRLAHVEKMEYKSVFN